jgi:hypothetical protein
LGQTGSVLAAVGVSVALTLACAVPLVWVDKAWTRVLNRVTKPFLKKPARTDMVKVSEVPVQRAGELAPDEMQVTAR